jgi:hypothetical protein
MHTYLKNNDSSYSIGMWLPNREGITAFVSLFEVNNFWDAVSAVCRLNGGDGSFNTVKERE